MIRPVEPIKLSGQVTPPQSKSLMHRYLICGGLSKEHTEIVCSNNSADILSTKICLTALGLSDNKGPVIGREVCQLDCGESGSTYRFLLPISAALGKSCEFYLRESLAERPMEPLYQTLRAHGVHKEEIRKGCIRTQGQLTAGTYLLPGDVSSQYVSGLLMALPLLKENSTIIVAGELPSRSYIDMTIAVMEEAGVHVNVQPQSHNGYIYKVPGGQTYNLKGPIDVEADWPTGAFWLAAGAISTGTIICDNMNPESVQGDRKIIDIMRRFGANITVSGRSVMAQPGHLRGIEIDVSDISDLIPPLAVLACAAEGITVIRNAEKLRMKETERLTTISMALNALGGDVAVMSDGLVIRGKGEKGLIGGRVDCFGDHRIVMMAAICSGICRERVIIKDADSVSKSYPSFFKELERLQQR